ncbi:MAG: PorT family protein [Bacteroidales bacterium]|nr:PorT family protein [Bacteroidales bacterium]MBN2763629.1 PorT family protein [Bacteroidales bacterium]
MPLFFKTLKPVYYIASLMAFFLICYPVSSRAQESDCSKTLQEARNQYDLGIIDEIPKMLGPCMQEGFTRTQKIEAYKLLVLAYLFDDNQFDAERTMLEFLKKYPEYEIMPNDPVEFIHLFETYRTTSEFSIGIVAGFNLTNPRIIENFSMLDRSSAKPDNETGSGYQIGLGAGRYLGERLMLNMEVLWAKYKYSFTDGRSVTDEALNVFTEDYTFDEELNKITIPLTALYQVNDGKLLWFIRAGGSFDYIMSASGTSWSVIKEQTETGRTIDIRNYRNPYYFSAIMGSGLQYKIPRGFLFLDFRFNMGINNIVKAGTRYENAYSLSAFGHLDDDFSLNTFTFSFGYHFSFYNPKKQR